MWGNASYPPQVEVGGVAYEDGTRFTQFYFGLHPQSWHQAVLVRSGCTMGGVGGLL
jgi:hypothetical protein